MRIRKNKKERRKETVRKNKREEQKERKKERERFGFRFISTSVEYLMPKPNNRRGTI